MDHRGPGLRALLGKEVLEGMKRVFKTKSHVVIYPASGTGAWEAALANTLSPGDKVLMYETGHFRDAVAEDGAAPRPGARSRSRATGARRRSRGNREAACATTRGREIRAVCVVHNETSTGVTSRIHAVREAINAAQHPALYMVDNDLVARLDRLSPRRVGRRRDGRRIAERD
jgi:alanine-glyoxylate transaminase/serine-glyoxylate transaminase/serine-pyruvate transaminase